MADIVITVDDSFDAELDAAFLALFSNPDSLTGRQLAVKHCENFLKDCLNRYRKKQAVEPVESAVSKADDLSAPEA